MEIFTISLISFGLSFLFALGGVGSALVLVPVLAWLGIPLGEAKPTGLFVNTISMVGATYDNIKNKRLDFGWVFPLFSALLFYLLLEPIFLALFPKNSFVYFYPFFIFCCQHFVVF